MRQITILQALLITTFLSASACGKPDQPSAAESAATPPAVPLEAVELDGFSWIKQDELAGLPHPGEGDELEGSLQFLAQQGIEVLVSLTETPTPSDRAAAHGIEILHLPVVDFTAPSDEQLRAFVEQTDLARQQERPVAVHCHAGLGRTGTFLAAWYIHQGMTADQALEEIRRQRPGSVETPTQEQALRAFESSQVAPSGSTSDS